MMISSSWVSYWLACNRDLARRCELQAQFTQVHAWDGFEAGILTNHL